MISRNKLKKAATSEGLRTLSTETKTKYVEDLKSRDNLSNTHIRAMDVLIRDLNIISNNEFVESLRTEKGALDEIEENLHVLGSKEAIINSDIFKDVTDARNKTADVFAGIDF